MKLIVLEEHVSENVGECILKKSFGLVDDQASKAGTELITFYPNILKNSLATIAIWVEAVRPVAMRNISFNKVIYEISYRSGIFRQQELHTSGKKILFELKVSTKTESFILML